MDETCQPMEWMDEDALPCISRCCFLESDLAWMVFRYPNCGCFALDLLEPANFPKAKVNQQLDVKGCFGRASLAQSGQNPSARPSRVGAKNFDGCCFVRFDACDLGSVVP